jgi:DNA-binding LytR/AlgR family response regulator
METLTCSLLIQSADIETKILDCAENFSSIQIAEIFKNPFDAFEKLNKTCSDILFVDIDFLHFNPVEFFKMINRPTFIIGLTENREKVLDLLDDGFFDLLFNPFTLEDFCKKIGKVIRIVQDIKANRFKVNAVSDNDLQYSIKQPLPLQKEFMFLKYRRVSTKIRFDDIIYIQNVGNVLKVFNENGAFFYHGSTLCKMLRSLPSNRFIRLNKSIIVNFAKIDKMERHLIYVKNQSFKLSRTYSYQLMDVLNKNTN